jgi:hypothetical protein
MNLNQLDQKKKIIIFIILLLLCFSGVIGLIYEYTFKYFYVETSRSYLDNSIDKSTSVFLSLSAIKAFTAVIEGSEIGVNAFGQFSLQVGDIVQSLYDIIDIMWKVSFVGVVALSVQKIFLEYFPTILLSHMVGISILFYAPSIFFENFFVSFLKKTSKFITILFVSVYFLIPFNIYIASKTSGYLDSKYKEPAIIKLQSETDKLSMLTTKLSKIQNKENYEEVKKETKWYDFSGQISDSVDNISSEFTTIFNNLKEIQNDLEVITSNILKVSITIITIYITNSILLPLIFLGLTYLFIQIVLLGQDNPIRRKRKTISSEKNN